MEYFKVHYWSRVRERTNTRLSSNYLPSAYAPSPISWVVPSIMDTLIDSSWNVMAHRDARERKWRGTWRMEWVASTLHTASEHGVSSITTADARNSAANIRPNWRPCRFKWTRPFRRKTKSGFCACANTFQLAFTFLRDRGMLLVLKEGRKRRRWGSKRPAWIRAIRNHYFGILLQWPRKATTKLCPKIQSTSLATQPFDPSS